jgi:hypothetical protein
MDFYHVLEDIGEGGRKKERKKEKEKRKKEKREGKKETGARNREEILLEQRTKSKTSCTPIYTEQN